MTRRLAARRKDPPDAPCFPNVLFFILWEVPLPDIDLINSAIANTLPQPDLTQLSLPQPQHSVGMYMIGPLVLSAWGRVFTRSGTCQEQEQLNLETREDCRDRRNGIDQCRLSLLFLPI